MRGGAQRHARRTAPPRPGLPAQQPVGLRHPSLPPSFLSGRLFRRRLPLPHQRSIPRERRGGRRGERRGEGGCEWRCWPLPPALFSPPDAGGTPLWHFLISRDYRCSYLGAAMMLDSSLEDGPSSQHPYSLHSPSLSLFVSPESRPYTVAGRSPSSVGGAAVGAPCFPPLSLSSSSVRFPPRSAPFLPCAVSPSVFCPPAGVERPFSRSSTQTRPPAERKSRGGGREGGRGQGDGRGRGEGGHRREEWGEGKGW